jgi:hypothetical protein
MCSMVTEQQQGRDIFVLNDSVMDQWLEDPKYLDSRVGSRCYMSPGLGPKQLVWTEEAEVQNGPEEIAFPTGTDCGEAARRLRSY